MQSRIKPMVESGVLSAIAIIFALISAYLPVVGPFANLVWPVPIILLGVRHGYKWSILATITAGIIIAIIMHPLHAVSIVVGFGFIGIVLGHAFRMGYNPAKTMLWGTIASIISKAAVIGIGILIVGTNPLNIQDDTMQQVVQETVNIYQSFGLSADDVAKLTDNMTMLVNIMKIVLPAGFIMAAVADTYINFVVARAVLRKMGHRIADFPPFREWDLPYYIAYLFIVGLLMLYWGHSRELTWLYNLGMNIQVLMSIFLFIQGLAVFYYLAYKYNLSRIARSIILFLIFTNGFFTQLLILTGVFDMFIDYRRIRTPRLK